MNQNNIYENYYKNHTGYIKGAQIERKKQIKQLGYKIEKRFNQILKGKDLSKVKILDIGCGQGYFAEYCSLRGIKHFVGFDLDPMIIDQNKARFPDYTFSSGDVFPHLSDNEDKYDMIFMSHVFEHIPTDRVVILIKLIYLGLVAGGGWLNLMPNAGSLFMGSFGRYNDNTHIQIYTESSFTTRIFDAIASKNFEIRSYNTQYCKNFIPYLLERIFRFFLASLVRLSGYPVQRVNSFEILSILTKGLK